MSEKATAPNEAIWATVASRVSQLESSMSSAATSSSETARILQSQITEIATTITMLGHIVRDTRRESPEQFQLTMAKAQRVMTSPPESVGMEELKRENVELRDAVKSLARQVEALMARPAVPIEPPKTRRKRAAGAPVTPVAPQSHPNPSDYAPDNAVPPPGLATDDDDDIPIRDRPFTPPSSMRFDEGQ